MIGLFLLHKTSFLPLTTTVFYSVMLYYSVMLFYSVILSVYSVILSEAGSSQRELRAQSKDPGNVCATVTTARHSPRALDHRPPFDWAPTGGVPHVTRAAH